MSTIVKDKNFYTQKSKEFSEFIAKQDVSLSKKKLPEFSLFFNDFKAQILSCEDKGAPPADLGEWQELAGK